MNSKTGNNRPSLELKNVSKLFESSGAIETLQILKQVNLAISAGESVAVVGPSGSGKSTLLNIIGTLDRPSNGQVLLDGQDITSLSDNELASLRNRNIGFVFQSHHLLPQCTVWENALVPTLASSDRNSRAQAASRAERLLNRVGLSGRLNHRPGQLSGGERQRVAVVRALVNQPKLLLADEPTGALDRASAHNLGDLLVELNREEKVTLIVVTHALDLAQRMSRVLELKDGQIV